MKRFSRRKFLRLLPIAAGVAAFGGITASSEHSFFEKHGYWSWESEIGETSPEGSEGRASGILTKNGWNKDGTNWISASGVTSKHSNRVANYGQEMLFNKLYDVNGRTWSPDDFYNKMHEGEEMAASIDVYGRKVVDGPIMQVPPPSYKDWATPMKIDRIAVLEIRKLEFWK